MGARAEAKRASALTFQDLPRSQPLDLFGVGCPNRKMSWVWILGRLCVSSSVYLRGSVLATVKPSELVSVSIGIDIASNLLHSTDP